MPKSNDFHSHPHFALLTSIPAFLYTSGRLYSPFPDYRALVPFQCLLNNKLSFKANPKSHHGRIFNIHIVIIKTEKCKRSYSFDSTSLNKLYSIFKSAIGHLQKILKLIFWKHSQIPNTPSIFDSFYHLPLSYFLHRLVNI